MAPLKRLLGVVFLLGCVGEFALSETARAVEFAGGTGEPNDPYQIATAEQLLAIGSGPSLNQKHYVLVASIDMSGTTLSKPITFTFWGTFDGKGHTIRNLRVQGGTGGLFGTLVRQAEVKNLGIVNAEITGAFNIAGLASWSSGRVVNCYSTGSVTSKSGPAGGLVAINMGTMINSYSSAKVMGGSQVGGLVSQNTGTISLCYSTGDVTGNGTVGGLAGFNGGEITSSHAVATVTALFAWAGGLVGSNSGRILSSYAEVTVTSQNNFVGGLAGQNRDLISNCYATGQVTGVDEVGGLVGINEGQVTTSYADIAVVGYGRCAGGVAGENRGGVWSCYSTGSVETGDEAGGLVGNNSGRILTSYSVATVVGYSAYTGGLVGRSTTSSRGVVTDSYFLDPLNGGGPDNGIGIPLTSTKMKQQASFVGWDFWGTAADGLEDLWFMPPQAYPVLVWQTGTTGLRAVPDVAGLPLDEARATLAAAGFAVGNVSSDFHETVPAGHVVYADPYPLAAAGATIRLIVSSGGTYDWTQNPGDGTAANPYQIQTAGQLESLIGHAELWSRHFALTADVDMAGRRYARALIAPDLDDSKDGGFQGTPFSGTFDGRGHVIRNLTIHRIDVRHDYVGLFGMIAPGGRIENLSLLNADIEGAGGMNSYVGILAGYNAGTVTNCSATGILDGGRGDGLVGFNSGSLINCQAQTTRI